MPTHAVPVHDERSAVEAFLIQQQDAFRNAAFGLRHDQLGATPTPSKLSVGALVKHVAATQEGWLASVLAAPELPAETGTQEERMRAYVDQFSWGGADSADEVLARFDDVSARVLDAVRHADLDAPVPVPPAPWNPKDVDHWSVRWVWFHLIEELARHAGHADIIREAVDGATMYALVAGREGHPDTPWVKAWRPEGEEPATAS